MSWMSKLFYNFKNVKEEKSDIDNRSISDKSDTSSLSKLKMQGGKEVESRVTYQYPKGRFRFPLIPDEEVAIDRKRTAPSPHNADFHKVNEKSRNRAERERERERNITHTPPVNKEPVIKPKKVEPAKRGSRPFKPTDVPSPVYGFKRPDPPKLKVEEEQVEFELTSFEHTNPRVESMVGVLNYEEVEREQVIADTAQHDENAELENIEVNPQLELEETTQNEELAELENIEVIPRLELEETAQNEELAELENIEVIPQLELEETAQNEELAELENIEVISQLELEVAVQNEELAELENIEVIPQLELEVTAQNEEIAGLENVEEFSQLKLEGDIQQDEIAEIESVEVIPQVELEETSSQASDVPKKERSHIPFNVIMLKQDKQKWEQNGKSLSVPQNKKPVVEEPLPKVEPVHSQYKFPPLQLLTPPVIVKDNDSWIDEQRGILNNTLRNFNVGAQVVNVTQGPSVTRFEVQPEPGVKVNKITNLSDDIKLSLAARDIRIEAPIPGKHTIGIEVPNRKSRPVLLSEIVNSPEFFQQESPLTAALGLDISGKPIVTDLRKMPHGLIAGATGSGKSVCINTILVSLLYKAKPEELKLLLIDPKMVELAPYNNIPHLVSPVITDVKAATASLKWAAEEMDRRYELFAHTGVRDIHRFNELAETHKQYSDKLPYIVIVIDELADLMMMSPADVEEAICRIAQKARACGIHLIIATQRPSVDVITGLIKANIPTRIAFSVSSQVDSRTIIDMSGAEKLLGKGDMLFLENGSSKPVRLQGTFVSDLEIDEVVLHSRKQGEPDYLFQQEELLKKAQVNEDEDELFYEACEFVVENGGASTSLLQRRFKIGYNRAARLIDLMEHQGFISESKGSKPRDILITEEELETIQETSIMN